MGEQSKIGRMELPESTIDLESLDLTSKYFRKRPRSEPLFVGYNFEIHESHIECLKEGNYLNDIVVDFYLNHLLRQLPADRREKVHVFPTQFWKKLQSTTDESPAAKHARVQRWTKDVDLFEKDFVLVPINEHFHWYLAIICFPGLEKPIYMDIFPSKKISKHARHYRETKKSESDNCTDINISNDIVPDGKRVVREPRIMVLDSMKKECQYKAVRILREYLTREWATRKRDLAPKEFVGRWGRHHKTAKCNLPSARILGFYPMAPQQDNLFDCGLFLLEFAEMFLRSGLPNWKFTKSGVDFGNHTADLQDWFPVMRGKEKRAELLKLMRELSTKWRDCDENSSSGSETVKKLRTSSSPEF